MGGLVRGRLLIWGDAMCLHAIIRSFKPPELHFLSFYHNLEVDKDCLVTQLCLFCIVTSLKILASYTLLLLLMYSCKFQLRNSIFIILYTITCALNDQSCRCAIKQHSFIHSISPLPQNSFSWLDREMSMAAGSSPSPRAAGHMVMSLGRHVDQSSSLVLVIPRKHISK